MDRKSEVRVKPISYQPSRKEIDQPVKIDAKPEDVIRAAFRQVEVVEDRDA